MILKQFTLIKQVFGKGCFIAILPTKAQDVSTLTVPADQPNELIAKLESMSTETTNPKKQPSSRLTK
jgi:beta-xylosidase